jgi:hypothetical protein
MKKLSRFLLAVLLGGGILVSCMQYLPQFRSHYYDLNTSVHTQTDSTIQPFLKIHMKNGYVAILQDRWIIDTLGRTIAGRGSLFDTNRSVIKVGELVIDEDDIAIAETNDKLSESSPIPLILLTIATVALSAYCLSNPKACFGSCPTFYTDDNTDFHYSMGEGFSNAIAPALAYGDIDALNNGHLTSHDYTLIMKNEALETHCVDDVHLLVHPRKPGQRIFHTPQDKFYLSDTTFTLLRAEHEGLEINELLCAQDMTEWFSLADSHNLSSKEEILLEFDLDQTVENAALLIGFRQTLMTTYFIYSAMGYMGDLVGDYFAEIETNPRIMKSIDEGITAELGKIEVYMRNSKQEAWEHQGGLNETGPIALNHQMIPLKHPVKPGMQCRLVLNKGLWRIDYTNLVSLGSEVNPAVIRPYALARNGQQEPEAQHSLETPGEYLISMPADSYSFKFRFPDPCADYEIFLYSKGYYLEWMRAQWLKDKNVIKLHQMLHRPKEYLRAEAAAYKEYEHTMEHTFWNSRITSQPLAYEN